MKYYRLYRLVSNVYFRYQRHRKTIDTDKIYNLYADTMLLADITYTPSGRVYYVQMSVRAKWIDLKPLINHFMDKGYKVNTEFFNRESLIEIDRPFNLWEKLLLTLMNHF